MSAKAKIDWDTVELVGDLVPVRADRPDLAKRRPAKRERPPMVVPPPREPRVFADRRGRSIVKKILSGAAAKARAHGSVYTHTQLRDLIPAGLETLIYGWKLLAAALESQRDFSRGVEIAAHAIYAAAHRTHRTSASSQ